MRTIAALALAPILALLVGAVLTPMPKELEAGQYAASVRFVDRDGALLREVRADDATRARWIPLEEVGAVPAMAVLAAEDRRFYAHPGIDFLAVLRATLSNLANGRVVSGGSTITMQLARLVHPRKRSMLGKFAQAALALRIEASLSKHDILEQYMNRAPFGPNLRGIDAASRFYFDKPPNQLSLAEAAALAAIPRGPAVYSLAKHPERVQRRRDRILDRMLAAGFIDAGARDRAKSEPLAIQSAKGTFGAPHLVQALLAGDFASDADSSGRAGTVTTTLSRELQREAEVSLRTSIRPLAKRRVTAASVVVLDNATGDVLAYVGSPDFSDAAHGGQNDGVRAKRQPGSTLKPFVYGLAMEELGFDARTLLPDVELHLPVKGGVFAPNNYDESFHGPVRLREALANSFNVPAVWTAAELGTPRVLDRLHDVGFASLRESPDWYGPGIALGDGEVTLLELANAYATIARGGVWKPVRVTMGGDAGSAERRVMPKDVASELTDILRDKNARLASFGERSTLELPFDVAAKTGTSKGFRDNWTVGFTREVTVAVWVGNFDGTAMEGVSGITGAGPIFHDVMQAAMRSRAARPMIDEGDGGDLVRVEVCPLSGGKPTPSCPQAIHEWLPKNHAPLASCAMHERIALDRRNGLRAGETCARTFTVERVFERYDPRFAAWARGAARPMAPESFSPLCPSTREMGTAAGALHIGFPRDGARYLIDPDRPLGRQMLSVRVEAPGGVERVDLVVDGELALHASSPYVAHWTLAPGRHVLVAEAKGFAPSEPVRVDVE